ncbi:MAG: OB-fold domain-containing protein [Actinobacteria bacterium]|nr:OB-fold domain-containing protein [Actinomycetota bacterium]MCB9388637.1 OB-fold domain-containing protein [Acidimicrobiia bacterium]
MRGILTFGTYLPHHRLDTSEIRNLIGSGGGRGRRTVASYDEDSTTMAVEAARRALSAADTTNTHAEPATVGDLAGPMAISRLMFATTSPAYADKTNATAIVAALSLPPTLLAFDLAGSARNGLAALVMALDSTADSLVVSSDVRSGRPGSADESGGGDGAGAFLIGDGVDIEPDRSPGDAATDEAPIAVSLGTASVSEEFMDRYRLPTQTHTSSWEERFSEGIYGRLAKACLEQVCARTRLVPTDFDHVVVTSPHPRAARCATRLGFADGSLHAPPEGIGNLGGTQPLVALADVLERCEPDARILVMNLADGADAVALQRTAEPLRDTGPSVQTQTGSGAPVSYGRYLAWRGELTPEPPRRPEPARVSAPAAARGADWKFGLVGSVDTDTGIVHLPPARVGIAGGTLDHMAPHRLASDTGTVVTFTIDRLAYSPSPPIVFAVVDFDRGGRLPVELTDVSPTDIAIGDRVQMTFRRLVTAQGVHNYFWKARPVQPTTPPASASDR